ncbi:hypothetical protein [Oligosphaera ethanolica]|uniref:Uncharacterized protein n=1 Tax=Oligosphaera ethanolica TaxID=760260 RepID=A0AAE3VDU4_9BACT|nr:hypothetical protein [Oligosphaera ethanolica]MDQ0288674.1 hypothetical protein [Oligosphaera ethanolica]
MYTPALRWDNLQETRGPPPPSHPTLISADLYGIGFIGVTIHAAGETGRVRSAWMTRTVY